MSPPTRKRSKSKRDNAMGMARLRETVDPDTGEVYHVETTRQAKRRHQRSGGAQFKPTVGQINAADIWNKQEEKIKRDKERQEKRKKDKLKQEAKDVRQRELQQELLSKGRITIEDTWGKVNASQNRLHRFFGAPQKTNPIATSVSEQEPHPAKDEEPHASSKHEEQADQLDNDAQETEIQAEDLEAFFATSPVSPAVPNAEEPVCARAALTDCKPVDLPSTSEHTALHPPSKSLIMRTLSASQTMMPPPPRLPTGSLSKVQTNEMIIESLQNLGGPSSTSGNLLSTERAPLGEMTMSQVNVRANEKPDPDAEAKHQAMLFPVATQVVRDTLSGLCPQDFDDDFADDEKENSSPFSFSKTPTSVESAGNLPASQNRLDKDGPHDSTAGHDLHQDDWFEEQELNLEDFDDEDIDDESLLSLAATQQLKQELFRSSKRNHKADDSWETGFPNMTTVSASELTSVPAPQSCSPRLICHQDLAPTFPERAGDSFAMDGIDDEDLLRGLNEYENDTDELDDGEFLRCVEGLEKNSSGENISTGRPAKKRRMLPWDRDPIPSLPGEAKCDDGAPDDVLTPSPVSLSLDE